MRYNLAILRCSWPAGSDLHESWPRGLVFSGRHRVLGRRAA